jgi:GAF domain-containing protein
MVAPAGSFAGDLGYELLIGVLVALAVGVLAFLGRRRIVARARGFFNDWRERRKFNAVAPALTEESIAYLTHLRDVTKTPWRARSDSPAKVRERIRREVMEPVRGIFTTPPGHEVKVVWFRPDGDGRHLIMYEQVGHTEEGQRELKLIVGASAAGKAFAEERVFESSDCANDPEFQKIEKGHATGSIICIPIYQGTRVTGVFSVLATWPDAFWVSDRTYFDALASAIGALEAFEGEESAAAMAK